MILFGLVWFLLMSVTYGTMVPSGLFLPGMIVGCAIGDLTSRSTVFLFRHYEEFEGFDVEDIENND